MAITGTTRISASSIKVELEQLLIEEVRYLTYLTTKSSMNVPGTAYCIICAEYTVPRASAFLKSAELKQKGSLNLTVTDEAKGVGKDRSVEKGVSLCLYVNSKFHKVCFLV